MIRVLLVLMCLSAGPVLAQGTDQPQGTIEVEDSATQDAAIAVRIRDILGELDGYEEITVTVSSGIVTLRGTTIDAPKAYFLAKLSYPTAFVLHQETVESGGRNWWVDNAVGTGPKLAYHKAKQPASISALPLSRSAPMCLCSQPPKPFGSSSSISVIMS